jgi:hypothetical protein
MTSKQKKQWAKEAQKCIEYNKLVAYWNNRLRKEKQPVPYYEKNEDLKRFRDNGFLFTIKNSNQLKLF